MKKLNNVLGLITLIVIIVLSMAACGDDSESDFDPGNSNHIDNNTLTWTVVTDSKFGSNSINSVAYGNGRWVAVGWDGRMSYSDNGKDWTKVENSNFGVDNILGISYGNGRWVAVGNYGKIAYSDDNGETWIMATNFGNINFQSVAYGNGRWVAGGYGSYNDKIAYSDDNGET